MTAQPIHIPPAALEAGARALASHYSYDWNENEELHAIWKEEAAACITKALKAWPGMQVRLNYFQPTEEIILPLMEKRDDE